MTLNRSSQWTTFNGEKIRVKCMNITQIQHAIVDLEQLELEENGDDPYIIQQVCSNSDCCHILPEPQHIKDGYLLEDWHNLLVQEISKRLKHLETFAIHPKVLIKKTNVLVKWLKFW